MRGSAVSGAALALQAAWVPQARAGLAQPGEGPYGPLAAEPDANGLLLPDGFTSRVIATGGEVVGETDYAWHLLADGGACFAVDDGGWVYVSNSEAVLGEGGVSAVRFDADGEIVDAYSILEGTTGNCAGGPTPWGTWLSCEEYDLRGGDDINADFVESVAGRVWECDPTKASQGTVLPALGAWNHEAVAVDPVGERLYLTEDEGNGLLYRFTPDSYPDLSSGLLEAARVDGSAVTWLEVPDPLASEVATRTQVPDATPFAGGEGIWFYEGVVAFTTKFDNKVHAIDVAADTYEVLYDAAALGDGAPLTGVDNVTFEEGSGDLYIAEDDGDMQLVILTPDGVVDPFLQVVGHDGSEITGPAFSPDGTRLYLSSQNGVNGESPGVTWEVTGPFRGAESRAAVDSTTSAPPSAPTTLKAASEQAAGDTGAGEDDGAPVPLIVGGAAVVAGAAAAGVIAMRRRGDHTAEG